LKRKIIFVLLILCFSAGLFVETCLLRAFNSTGNRGDCHMHPPFARRLYPSQAVFQAKILYAPKWNPDDGREPWALALVQRRYWGVPWWGSKLIILGHSAPYLKQGSEYFVDAEWSENRRSAFLPYVEFHCDTRTEALKDATVELRLLEDGPPKSGVRIIGRTLRLSPDGRHYPVGGIAVEISGPNGTVSTVSDQSAVYDVSGLPPGHYTVTSNSADDLDASHENLYERLEGSLRSGDVWGRDVFTK
jgi:hypothetical protein